MNLFKSLKNRKGMSGAVKGAMVFLTLAFIIASVSYMIPAFANTHTANATLEPEWSPANEHVDYSVEFCKNTGDIVNEVRIYKNWDGSIHYTNFECADKAGWEKLYISTYPACFYVADESSPDYDPLNEDGECETFYFSAHSPGPEYCDLEWKFETRDVKDYWQYEYDKTSVDDKAPEITKDFVGPYSGPCPPGEGEECWVSIGTKTTIKISVEDKGECGVSGLDYCKITYTIDGGTPIEEVYADLNGEKTWQYDMKFKEDSLHVLTVECKDIAGNILLDEEKFRVDGTPPVTTKQFNGPQKIDPVTGVEWIDGVTTVTLFPTDPEAITTPPGVDCSIGVDKTWYKDFLAPSEDWCRYPEEYCTADGVKYCNSCEKGIYPKECMDTVQEDCEDLKSNPCASRCKIACESDPEPELCLEKCIEEKCTYKTWYECVQKESNERCCGGWDWTLYTGSPIPKNEESCHVLYYFSVDDLGNLEPINANCFFVDKTPPEIDKNVGDPKVDASGVKFSTSGTGTAGWSSEQAYNGIFSAKMTTPTSSDQGRATLPFSGLLGDITSFSYWSYDVNAGTEGQLSIWPSFYLDDNDDGTWDYYLQCEPYYTYGNPTLNTWENYDIMNMKCVAYEYAGDCPHDSPTLAQYINGDATSMECPGHPEWGKFASQEYGSLKIIKIDMRAGYGGPWPGFVGYIDDVTINGDKVLSEPSWWVTQNTPITLKCQDIGPHPSDDVTIYWSYTVDGGLPVTGSHKGESYDLYFPQDSVHVLEFWCKDAVEKESIHDIETFKVDTVPPSITKTMIGDDHLGDCPPGPSPIEPCYVKDSRENGVQVNVTDGGAICAVDQTDCYYELWWMGKVIDSGHFGEEGKDIIFTEDSEHILKINCKDALGNAMLEDVETFLVDSLPPVTIKTYGTPTKVLEGYRWITKDTEIKLDATDNKVGVDKIYWRVTPLFITDESCLETCKYEGSGGWQEIAGNKTTFKIGEDSCHLIEFYAVDKLGNTELINHQCVFVDNKPPVTVKTFDGKVVDIDGDKYINQNTEIILTCNDQIPHPVDHSMVWYRYRFAKTCDELEDATWIEWEDTPISSDPAIKTIQFTEDSCHELEYYCVDALGNKEDTKSEIDIVDTKAPEITKTIVGPSIGDCLPKGEEDECYIDGKTKIHVEVTDPEPHPVNNVLCSWDYEVIDGDKTGQGQTEIKPPFDIQFLEESTHKLYIKCWDALYNTVTDTEKFIVDKTPPATTKTYGDTHYPDTIIEDQYPHYISNKTQITLTVEDAGPHKTGVKEVNYRWFIVPDENCESYETCQKYDASKVTKVFDKASPQLVKDSYEPVTFTIPEESCHMIEYYSVDNVDKTETIHKQCVYVDNTAPNVTKIISDPKEKWEGDDTFYPGLKARCASGEIECWKITMGNTLNITCNDPEPHPVDHSKMCFQIELDGDDVTEKYCGIYGVFNESGDGYCCRTKPLEEFRFTEESQHDLKVKCIDALGNEGEVDEEKFKVEGCTYGLCLYKKWNLISVPFTLFKDDPEEVFKDAKDQIVSVWTYDNYQWYSWVPGVGGTLEHIKPGWGYWILSKEDKCFEIAGSSFSPLEVPPSRELQSGWNLIGYYGNTGMLDGIEFSVVDGRCVMLGKPVYCALNSLVDTQEGFPRWSSLWNFYNYGGDVAGWRGLSACVSERMPTDNMEPGKGYWIEMDVKDGYAPATNCIWNKDFKCVKSLTPA